MTFQRFDIQHNGRTALTPIGSDPELLDIDDAPLSPGRAVQVIREERHMSVMDLAHRAGMFVDHVQAIEAGLAPTVPEIQALAVALGVPTERIGPAAHSRS